jgi:hypothetical protein
MALERTGDDKVYQGAIFSDKLINLLYATLVAVAPKDTEFMRSNIKLYYYGAFGSEVVAKIVISPGVPYARKTNEWNYPNKIRADGKPSKQYYNYLWVDRTITTTCQIIAEAEGANLKGGITGTGR